MARPATPDDVDRICGELPETEFGISWGDRPTWKVPRGNKGKGFLLYRMPHQTAVDPDRPQDVVRRQSCGVRHLGAASAPASPRCSRTSRFGARFAHASVMISRSSSTSSSPSRDSCTSTAS